MSLDISLTAVRPTEVFSANYTHNVVPMWNLAGVYDALYNSHGKRAIDVLAQLEAGVAHMRANPEAYMPLNPANGWGDYESALQWLEELTAQFRANHEAKIGVFA